MGSSYFNNIFHYNQPTLLSGSILHHGLTFTGPFKSPISYSLFNDSNTLKGLGIPLIPTLYILSGATALMLSPSMSLVPIHVGIRVVQICWGGLESENVWISEGEQMGLAFNF